MNKNIITFVAIILCATCVSPTYGQGFFDKLSKGLEAVDKGLDKVLTGDTKSASYSKNKLPEIANKGMNYAYNSTLIRSFSPNVEIVLESCIRESSKVTITYYATNNGEEVVFDKLGISKNVINKTEETRIIGDTGEGYQLRYYTVGSDSESSARTTFPSGVRVKCTLEIYGVSSSVRQLQLVNIAGLKINSSGNNQFTPLSFSFRNVPIYTQQQILGMMNAKTLHIVENPAIAKSPDPNYSIESVEFTDKYTKVDLSYKNDRYSPTAYLTLNTQPEVSISANGVTYRLIGYWGITPRAEDIVIKYHDTGRYTYIFEPLPSDVASFDILGDNLYGVTLKSSINIPKTRGMFPSLETSYNAFYKNTRMTPAERTKYKIDNIKHADLPRPLLNKQLAKGKLIYRSDKGRIETFLFIVPDQITCEYLVSYDAASRVIDCICIGNISAYGGDRGYAEFVGDKINVHSSYPSDEGDIVESVEQYRISEDLKFIAPKK